MNTTEKSLGTIELSDTVLITDPCYTRGTWCAGVLTDVRPGQYETAVVYSDEGDWGRRVASLHARHKDYKFSANREDTGIDVGVDSGQAGIFDDSIYPARETGEYDDKKSFYGRVCELTCDMKKNGPTKNQGGTIDGKGVVSSSGYGDGSYQCFVGRDMNNKIVDISIIFLGNEETDEDDPYGNEQEEN